VTDNKTWFNYQEKFLSDHEFLTNTGKLLRSVTIENQIDALKGCNK